jgi:tRNA(His) 5'-end guanylyltransferase
MDDLLTYIKQVLGSLDPSDSGDFGDSLKMRMQSLLSDYNSDTFTQYKPYIVSLKSKEILEYLNFQKESLHVKLDEWNEYNKILMNVTKECYNRFNPLMIYTFNDEIHMVFYNVSDYPDLYNGNINKTITTMASFVTRMFTKEFMKNQINFDFTIGAKHVEFSSEYEVLNYLIWRQFDCKRNNIITLYKYFKSDVKDMQLEDVTQMLFHNLNDINITHSQLNFLIYGNILKKELVYIENKYETELSSRKQLHISHELLHENFKENLTKYIFNTYL